MKKIIVCFALIFALIFQDVSAGKKMKGLLEAGLLMAGLMPQPMPLPIPFPIPIRIERSHHHKPQHCSAHPIHIHRDVELIPFPVETKVEPKKKKEYHYMERDHSMLGGDDQNNSPV